MRCRSCHHWRRLSQPELDAMLDVRDPNGQVYSLRHLPTVRDGLREDVIGLCGLKAELSSSRAICEYHSLPVLGRLWGIPDDVAHEEIERARETRRAEWEALKRAEMSRPVERKPCGLCGRLHARCLVCDAPMMLCGKCPECKRPVRTTTAGWICGYCGRNGEGVPADPLTYGPDGTCEGCRETLAHGRN